MQPKIHRVGPGDVDVLRATRLRALADTPAAFGTTLAATESRPRDFWIAQAGGRLGDRPCATWLAVDAAGTGVGMITGIDQGDSINTVQVWIAPHHRGTGLVDRLFGALFEWSRTTESISPRQKATSALDPPTGDSASRSSVIAPASMRPSCC